MLLEIAFSVSVFLGLVLFLFGMGSFFADAFGVKRRVDELVLRIGSSRLAAGRIAVPWTRIPRKERAELRGFDYSGLVANSRQHQERRRDDKA
jgi:hypothetical protein